MPVEGVPGGPQSVVPGVRQKEDSQAAPQSPEQKPRVRPGRLRVNEPPGRLEGAENPSLGQKHHKDFAPSSYATSHFLCFLPQLSSREKILIRFT